MATNPDFPRKAAARAAAFATASRQSRCSCTAAIAAGARETGAAFAINALIESSRVEVLSGQPEPAVTPSNSGRGRRSFAVRNAGLRCGATTRWRAGIQLRARRDVGQPRSLAARHPHLHVVEAAVGDLPPDVPAAAEYYDRNAHWPPHSLERRRVLLAALAANQNEAPAASLRRAG